MAEPTGCNAAPRNAALCGVFRRTQVSREINFTSQEIMENFALLQKVYFQGVCMEGTAGFVEFGHRRLARVWIRAQARGAHRS